MQSEEFLTEHIENQLKKITAQNLNTNKLLSLTSFSRMKHSELKKQTPWAWALDYII